jgi:hypothetical protein
LQASNNQSSVKAGAKILLVGLILQMVSYVCFIVLVLAAHRKIRQDPMITGLERWWKIIWLLYFSSICIMVSRNHPNICEYSLMPSCSLDSLHLPHCRVCARLRWVRFFYPILFISFIMFAHRYLVTHESQHSLLIVSYPVMLTPSHSLLLSPRLLAAFTRNLCLHSFLARQILHS